MVSGMVGTGTALGVVLVSLLAVPAQAAEPTAGGVNATSRAVTSPTTAQDLAAPDVTSLADVLKSAISQGAPGAMARLRAAHGRRLCAEGRCPRGTVAHGA